MKIDSKVLFIIVLAGALILSLIFRPKKEIDMYEDEINDLKQRTEQLLNSNDSIKGVNEVLTKRIDSLLVSIDGKQAEIDKKQGEIDNLEDEKGKVSDRVRNLNADSIAITLSGYLNSRK
jgi:chromosome segregation ATPase